MLFSNILLAYDGSNLSKKALQKAIKFVEQNPETKLEVIHVYQFPVFVVGDALMTASAEMQKDYYETAQSAVNEANEQIKHLQHAKGTILQGQPAVAILDYAEKIEADLIIMGSRGLSGIREFILGSVSHNVVQHAKIPVLIVK